MKVESLAIACVKLLTPRVFRDARGFFAETWSERALSEAGIEARFVQDNHALSVKEGTVRALHFQLAPLAQDKLVRAIRGSIRDVAVDLRPGSATYGKHVAAVLTAESFQQMWVPKGFAHGYVSLEPMTEVVYKVTVPYSAAHDSGIQWDDPALGIDWGYTRANAVLSEKDANLKPLSSKTTVL